jgi:hypothetical protein
MVFFLAKEPLLLAVSLFSKLDLLSKHHRGSAFVWALWSVLVGMHFLALLFMTPI